MAKTKTAPRTARAKPKAAPDPEPDITPADPLAPRMRAFVDAYLIEPNATQAAKAAGYSAKTAAEQGARLLRNVQVADEIARRQAVRSEAAKLTADAVLREIDTLATSDIGALFDLSADALRMLPMAEWPAEARKAVSSIKVKVYPIDKPEIDDGDLADLERMAENLTNPLLRRFVTLMRDVRWDQYQIVELKLWDKNSALDKAGKHRGLFADKGIGVDDVRARLAKQIDNLMAGLSPAEAEKAIALIRPAWVA